MVATLEQSGAVVLAERDLTAEIIGAAIAVHKVLGPGLLESAYQSCLGRELGLRKEHSFPF